MKCWLKVMMKKTMAAASGFLICGLRWCLCGGEMVVDEGVYGERWRGRVSNVLVLEKMEGVSTLGLALIL